MRHDDDLTALAVAVGVLDGGPRDHDLTDPARSKK